MRNDYFEDEQMMEEEISSWKSSGLSSQQIMDRLIDECGFNQEDLCLQLIDNIY